MNTETCNPPTATDLSVIIGSYNTRDLLRGCLKSIYDNTRECAFEVIVIDDCSTDDSPAMVRQEFPQVRLVCNTTNQRYAKVNNAGLRMARGRYGLLLNSDVEVQPGAFDTLVRFMDEHPDAAAAGPKLINPDGSIQHCIRSFPGLLPIVCQSLNVHKLLPGNRLTDQYYNTRFDYNRAQTVQSIGTTSFILRRSTWERYGLLDERFTHFFVDLAYCFMLGQHRQPIYYVSDAVVLHYGSQSINQAGLKEIRLLHEALADFYALCYAPRHRAPTRMIIQAGIRLRKRLKMLEYYLSSDKRVIKGPGAPALPGRKGGAGGPGAFRKRTDS
ncbi:MAG: glycosyltransferase family 2 protein [Armatimonadetes bacterium]|nr:glycosyltransferase family 2 protein [Armatimonadota bacterium]